MLKIKGIPDVFLLRNKWHNKIAEEMDAKSFPYKFHIKGMHKSEDKGEKRYLAEDMEGKGRRFYITEPALQYIAAEEVPDCNPGMYFKDYLPEEGSYILIHDKQKIIPAKLEMRIYLILNEEIPKEESWLVDLVLQNMVDMYKCSSVYEKKNCMWKYAAYPCMIEKAVARSLDGITLDRHALEISTYMDEAEKMYQDTIIHKAVVKQVMDKFAEYLETKEKLLPDAEELRKKAVIHDNSKLLDKAEFQALAGIINDKSCLRDAKSALSPYKQDAVELHWQNNEHHPEHYKSPDLMPRTARYEFVCDCCARSLQYGTDLISFMEERQKNRFHFSQIMYEEIIRYCHIAVSL